MSSLYGPALSSGWTWMLLCMRLGSVRLGIACMEHSVLEGVWKHWDRTLGIYLGEKNWSYRTAHIRFAVFRLVLLVAILLGLNILQTHAPAQFSQGPVSPEAPCEASMVRKMVLEAQCKRFVWARMCLSVWKGFRGLGCEQKRDVFFLLCFSWKGHRGSGILPLQGLQLFPFSDLPEATFLNKEVGWGIPAWCDIWVVCSLVLSAPVRGVWLHWSWRRVECCLTCFVNSLGIASYRVQYPQWLLSSVWQNCARAFLLPCWSL